MRNANLKNGLATVKNILKENEYKSYIIAGRIGSDINDLTGQALNTYRAVGMIVNANNVEEVYELAERKATRYRENYIYILGTNAPTVVALVVRDYSFYLARYADLLGIIHV